MSSAGAAVFEERLDPGKFTSAVLAAAVHFALLAVLVFGVRWQNRPPESVTVELWEPPPPAPAVEAPKPVPVPEPPLAVEVKPEAAKPEPVVPKPEIVEKKAPPPKPKPQPRIETKPVPKAEPLKPRVDETQRLFRDQLAREEASLAHQHIKDQLARETSAATEKARAEWVDKIRTKIRGNIVLPPDLQGNPEAQIMVVLLPTGEVLSRRITKSSGHRGYDDAVERALLKSSPLPKPDRPEIFSRELKLTFRPKD
jgi:colicin import membrane protein